MSIKSLPNKWRNRALNLKDESYHYATMEVEKCKRELKSALPVWVTMSALDKYTHPDDGELVLVVTQYHGTPEFAEWSEPTGQFIFPATDGYISRNDGLIKWRHMCDLDTP